MAPAGKHAAESRTNRSRALSGCHARILARFKREGKPHDGHKSRIFNYLEELLVPSPVRN